MVNHPPFSITWHLFYKAKRGGSKMAIKDGVGFFNGEGAGDMLCRYFSCDFIGN